MSRNGKSKWFINQLLDALQSIGRKKLDLHLAPYLLLIGLAKFTDKDGECYPLQRQIENVCGVEKSNMHRSLKILSAKKFIKITRKYDRRNRMTRNYYKIDLQAILRVNLDDKNAPNVDVVEVKQSCTQIEPNVMETFDRNVMVTFATIKTTQTTKLPNKALNIVRFASDDLPTDNILNISDDVHFERFWQFYPRKEKKKEARRIWIREKLDRIAEVIILDVQQRQIKHDRWEDKAFIPLATSYLNGELWNDEIVERSTHGQTAPNRFVARESKREEAIRKGFDEYERNRRK